MQITKWTQCWKGRKTHKAQKVGNYIRHEHTSCSLFLKPHVLLWLVHEENNFDVILINPLVLYLQMSIDLIFIANKVLN